MSPEAASHPKEGWLATEGRAEFPMVLRRLGLGVHDMSVEVGTWQGNYSRTFLDRWEAGGQHMVVDPWRHFDQYSDSVNAPQSEQDSRYHEALEKLRPHGRRVVVARTTSEEAAKLFRDDGGHADDAHGRESGGVGFVYLDGDHCYVAVMQDLRAWWPKLRHGGVMAGHDWDMHGEGLRVSIYGIMLCVVGVYIQNGVG
jgi:hypothetical protein